MDSAAQPAQPPYWSNNTEGAMWDQRWCGRCVHDAAFRAGFGGAGCELIAISFLDAPVPGWVVSGEPYPFHVTCSKFQAVGA